MLSQLPDAPTDDPKDIEDETDDDFVVIEKADAQEDRPKAGL
jgi:hypothetical protein